MLFEFAGLALALGIGLLIGTGQWRELPFWLWCRWTDHLLMPKRLIVMTRAAEPSRLEFRVCRVCGRVHAHDLLALLKRLPAADRDLVLEELGVSQEQYDNEARS